MPALAKHAPRLLLLGVVLAAFCVFPPEAWARGPDLCVWRRVLHLAACPACGSVRALAAFFHGEFAPALAFNPNVALTAPALVVLVALDLRRAFRP